MMAGLSEEQQEIISAVHNVCDRYASSTHVRESFGGIATTLWEKLAHEIGAAAIAIPEEFEGVGLSLFESHLILETLGQYLAHTPFLSSAVVGAEAIKASKNQDVTTKYLSQIASGEEIVTLAWASPNGQWDPEAVTLTASPNGDQWELNGNIPFVLDGQEATL